MANNIELATQDAALASVGAKTTIYGYAGSMYGFLADNGVAIAIGTIVTIGGFVMNWYFQRRRNQREIEAAEAKERREIEMHSWAREEHLLRMEKLRNEMNDQ